MVGKQPDQGGVWREIFVYRARRMVQIYRIESHGRRYYRSLEYTTDARFTLRSMQPSTDHRQQPWPSWGRHEAGHPYASSYNNPASAVITRDWTVEANLSLGTETFMPSRLMWGLVPHALLEEYEFWQDESDQLRGYPKLKRARSRAVVEATVTTSLSSLFASAPAVMLHSLVANTIVSASLITRSLLHAPLCCV